MPVTIRWTAADTGVLGWAFDRLGAVMPERHGRAENTAWPSLQVYSTVFEAPLKGRKALKSAAEFALPQLMPIDPDDLVVFGRTMLGHVQLAAVRKRDIGDKTKRIQLAEDWIELTPKARRESDRRSVLAALGAVALVAALIALQVRLLARSQDEMAELAQQQTVVSTNAKAAAARRNTLDLWATLKETRPNERLPSQILSRVSQFSAVLPEGAFWKRVTWDAKQVVIEGLAREPIAVLSAYAKLPDATARFSKPVVPTGDGSQQFEIAVTPREKGDE